MKFLTHNRQHLITLALVLLSLVMLFGLPGLSEAQVRTDNGGGAGPTKVVNSDISMLAKLGATIGNMMLSIGAYITWFGGSLLDMSITSFVVGIGTLLANGTPIGTAINTVWVLIRDICNLAFIFGFIYVGIRTIIDSDSTSTKRFLASIIIGALLINFSLFFCKIIIDVGNYISVEIYNTLIVGTNGGTISARFGELLGIKQFFSLGANVEEFVNRGAGANVAYYFMATIMLIVAGFVLAAGAILLMIRFVALVLIMCFSPILFAATVFPATAGLASDLWKKLINYSLFAPAYLLMLVVSITVLNGVVQTMRAGNSLSNALGGEGTAAAFSVVLSFGICIFFLIMSLQVAQKFSLAGGTKAVSFGNTLRNGAQRSIGKAAGGATFGASAAALRATAGRGASAASKSTRLRDAASQKGLKGFIARQAYKGVKVGADSSFDARKVGGVGGKLHIGEGRTGGYDTVMKEVKEKEEKFAKSLGEIEDDDVRLMGRKKEMQAEERKLLEADEELRRERKRVLDLGANATDADKDSLIRKREAVDDQKKKIEEAKINYESEKQRRIIGSTYAEPANAVDVGVLNGHKTAVKLKKGEIKDQWNGRAADPANNIAAIASYASLAEADKKARRDIIEGLGKDLEDLEKVRDKFMSDNIKDRGYAGVLEKSSKMTAWPAGRTVHQEKKAGKEIRETAEKGLPKKKED